MNMKFFATALFGASCVCTAVASSEYTYQALYWQVDSNNIKPYSDVLAANLYAVVTDQGQDIRIGGKYPQVISVAEGGTSTVLVKDGDAGVGELWQWGSYDISSATFFVELLAVEGGERLVSVGTSYGASYPSLVNCMDRNKTGSGDPGTTAATYTFYFPIPEPTSGVLLLLGVAGLALKRKRLI